MNARDLLILIDGRVEFLRNASMSDDAREDRFDKYLETPGGQKILGAVLDTLDAAVASITVAR
jgi:hypothetical protein